MRPPRARDILGIDDIADPVERVQQLGPPRGGGVEFGDERAQHAHVREQRRDREIAECDLDAAERIDRVLPRGRGVAEVRRLEGEEAPDIRVGGRLDVDVDAALRVHRRRDRAVEGREPLDGGTLRAPDEPLALEARLAGRETEVDHELRARRDGEETLRVAPLRRHGSRHVEPRRAPRASPCIADRDGCEGALERRRERFRLAGQLPRGHREGRARAVDGGLEALADETIDAQFDQMGAVVHGGSLSVSAISP